MIIGIVTEVAVFFFSEYEGLVADARSHTALVMPSLDALLARKVLVTRAGTPDASGLIGP